VTAKLSAYYRKFSDIAFAAEFDSLIGADEAFAKLVRRSPRGTRGEVSVSPASLAYANAVACGAEGLIGAPGDGARFGLAFRAEVDYDPRGLGRAASTVEGLGSIAFERCEVASSSALLSRSRSGSPRRSVS
jgi:hypothetical protein